MLYRKLKIDPKPSFVGYRLVFYITDRFLCESYEYNYKNKEEAERIYDKMQEAIGMEHEEDFLNEEFCIEYGRLADNFALIEYCANGDKYILSKSRNNLGQVET